MLAWVGQFHRGWLSRWLYQAPLYVLAGVLQLDRFLTPTILHSALSVFYMVPTLVMSIFSTCFYSWMPFQIPTILQCGPVCIYTYPLGYFFFSYQSILTWLQLLYLIESFQLCTSPANKCTLLPNLTLQVKHIPNHPMPRL